MEGRHKRFVKKYEEKKKLDINNNLLPLLQFSGDATLYTGLLSTLFFYGSGLVGGVVLSDILLCSGCILLSFSFGSFQVCCITAMNILTKTDNDEYDIENFCDYIKYLFYKAYEETFLDKLKDYLISIGKYDNCKIDEDKLLDSIQNDIDIAYKNFIENKQISFKENNVPVKLTIQEIQTLITKNNQNYSQQDTRDITKDVVDNINLSKKNKEFVIGIIKDYLKNNIKKCITNINYKFLFDAKERTFWQSISTSKPVEAIKSGWNTFTSWFGKTEAEDNIVEIRSINNILDIEKKHKNNKNNNEEEENNNITQLNNESDVEQNENINSYNNNSQNNINNNIILINLDNESCKGEKNIINTSMY